MKYWIGWQQTYGESGRRFLAASILGICFCLLLAWRLYLLDDTASFDVVFSPTWGRVLWANFCGVFLVLPWTVFWERRGPRSAYVSLLSLAFPVGLYGIFQALPFERYLFLYGTGVSVAPLWLTVFLCKKTRMDTLFSRLFVGFWKAAGIGALSFLLLVLCHGAVDTLLLPVSWKWTYAYLAFAVMVPGAQTFFTAFPRVGEEARSSRPFFLLMRNILLPAYTVMMLILYGYMGKMLLTWDMPVGTMNWYASFAVFVYALFYLAFHGDEDTRIGLFLRMAAVALVPVVAVQLFGVYIRIAAYGLTDMRYMSLYCTAFGIVILGFGYFRKGARPLYALATVLCLIVTVTPMNIIDFPVYHQKARLAAFMETYGVTEQEGGYRTEKTISPDDARQMQSAYDYVTYHTEYEEDHTSDRMEFERFLSPFLPNEPMAYYDLSYHWETLPVGGYRNLYLVNSKEGNIVTIKTDKGEESFDLTPFYERMERMGLYTIEEPTPDHMTYIYDSTHIFYFSHIFSSVDEGTRHWSAEGFLLVK